jgi:outer membrane protein assembly factor BamB
MPETRLMHRFLLTPFALFLCVTAGRAEDWPCWRGPRLDGTSAETGVPIRWSPTENIRWKTALPGKGHSSPVVWGDRVFVTSCVEDKGERLLLCLDRRDGKVLWQRVVMTSKLERKHHLNSFASATPATDGKHVWVAFLDFPNAQVYCYDIDGNKIWQKSPGKLLSVHGFCSSPILYKDTIIVNGDQDAEGWLVALDQNTGAEKWRVNRPNKTRSYCVPILVTCARRPGVTQLVLSGSKCVTSYNADTGELLWIIDGPTEQYVASLVFLDEMLFLTTGFPQYHLMGIRADGSGNITKTDHIAWHIGHNENKARGASYVPSPIAADGHFFVVSDPGFLSCLEAQTGKRVWMQKLGRRHSASPVRAGGYLYFPDDDGNTHVVKASRTFEPVAKNPLGEEVYASPAVSHSQLLLRGVHHLFCIGQ